MKKYLRAALFIAPLVLLTGCARLVGKVADLEDTSILNPMPLAASQQGGESLNRDNAAQRAVDQVSFGTPAATANAKTFQISENASFYAQQLASSKLPNNSVAAKSYLSSGIALSNVLCEVWFQKLGVATVTVHQTADTISAAGFLTAAIMGAANASSESIGLISALAGTSKQLTDSVAANYLISPDLAAVRRALYDYRALYAKDMLDSTQTWNFYTAQMALISYDNTCSQLGVKTFVTNRIEDGKANPQAPLQEVGLKQFLSENGTKFFDGVTLTNQTLVDFYAYAFLAPTDATVKTKLSERLKAAKILKDASTGTDDTDFTFLQSTPPVTKAFVVNKLMIANLGTYIADLGQKDIKDIADGLEVTAAAANKTLVTPAAATAITSDVPARADGTPLTTAPKP